MKRALLIIDYTNDFVALDGALTCGDPAIQIENQIHALAKDFLESNDFIVFAVDKHDARDHYHPENNLFPSHNQNKTIGRQLFGNIEQFYQSNKDNRQLYFMDKTRYSCFAGTDLYIKLRERNITEIHVCGVCTDICVLHTLVDAYNLSYQLFVHQNAVASFNPTGHDWALEHFRNCLGATII